MGPVKPEMIMGYSEEERLKRLMVCNEFLTSQFNEVKTRLAKIKEIANKAHKKADKEKAA